MSNPRKAENLYSLGYTHGIQQARPVVDLEHRVTQLESRVHFLNWAAAVASLVGGFLFVWNLPLFKNFMGRKADEKEFLRWKSDKARSEAKNQTATSKRERQPRHIRDFRVAE
jgi:hypothetical protein